MLWPFEIILEAILAVWLCVRPDGRRSFQALICVNLAFEIVYFYADRIGNHTYNKQIWWLIVVAEVPLISRALTEAADWRQRRHLTILAWWVSATMACAWIRFYPYTGAATVVVNQVAFAAWLWQKFSMRR